LDSSRDSDIVEPVTPESFLPVRRHLRRCSRPPLRGLFTLRSRWSRGPPPRPFRRRRSWVCRPQPCRVNPRRRSWSRATPPCLVILLRRPPGRSFRISRRPPRAVRPCLSSGYVRRSVGTVIVAGCGYQLPGLRVGVAGAVVAQTSVAARRRHCCLCRCQFRGGATCFSVPPWRRWGPSASASAVFSLPAAVLLVAPRRTRIGQPLRVSGWNRFLRTGHVRSTPVVNRRGRARGCYEQWPRAEACPPQQSGEQSSQRNRSRNSSGHRQDPDPVARPPSASADNELPSSRVERLEKNFERLIEVLSKKQ